MVRLAAVLAIALLVPLATGQVYEPSPPSIGGSHGTIPVGSIETFTLLGPAIFVEGGVRDVSDEDAWCAVGLQITPQGSSSVVVEEWRDVGGAAAWDSAYQPGLQQQKYDWFYVWPALAAGDYDVWAIARNCIGQETRSLEPDLTALSNPLPHVEREPCTYDAAGATVLGCPLGGWTAEPGAKGVKSLHYIKWHNYGGTTGSATFTMDSVFGRVEDGQAAGIIGLGTVGSTTFGPDADDSNALVKATGDVNTNPTFTGCLVPGTTDPDYLRFQPHLVILDQDGDGSPAVYDMCLVGPYGSSASNGTYRPGYRQVAGPDPDDQDASTSFPVGAGEVVVVPLIFDPLAVEGMLTNAEDLDGDGVPRFTGRCLAQVAVSGGFNLGTSPLFATPVKPAVGVGGFSCQWGDRHDDNPNIPINGSAAGFRVVFQVPSPGAPIVEDSDGDGVYAVKVQMVEHTYDAGVVSSSGPRWQTVAGDPDDGDPSVPAPESGDVTLVFPAPSASYEVRDDDGDGVPTVVGPGQVVYATDADALRVVAQMIQNAANGAPPASAAIPIDGNIRFHTAGSGSSPASTTLVASPVDADGAIAVSVAAGADAWLAYEIVDVPSPLRQGTYRAAFSA